MKETKTMSTKMTMPRKDAEETAPVAPGQGRAVMERYRLQVDRQTKTSYATRDAAEAGGLRHQEGAPAGSGGGARPRQGEHDHRDIKFGNGNVTAVEGNKLTIAFDKAGEKRVVDRFVERVGGARPQAAINPLCANSRHHSITSSARSRQN